MHNNKIINTIKRIGYTVALTAMMACASYAAPTPDLVTKRYSYTGGVTDGKQNGFGVCRYTNGDVYSGYWNMGYKEGMGRLVKANGDVEFGTWNHGVLVPSSARFDAGDFCYGLDVSKYQQTIDWERMYLAANVNGYVPSVGQGQLKVTSKAKKKGRRRARNRVTVIPEPYRQPVSFVIMKSTQGTTIVDPQFARNFAEAKRVGIIRGAYHFLSTSASAEEQAAFFIANTPLEKGDFPPVLDFEISKSIMNVDHAKVVKMAKIWLNIVEAHYGVKPIIYTYDNYYRDYLKGHGFDGYDYWIARYGSEPTSYHWMMWQFTDKGWCEGIKHRVDIDVFKGNFKEFRNYVHRKGVK